MLDKDRFAEALETLRSGIYIVTSMEGEQPAGCTCVWLARMSFQPPLLTVTMAPGRHTLAVIEKSGLLCINVLGEGGVELARRFGFNSGAEYDKFHGVDWLAGANGCPVLSQAIAHFECGLHKLLEIGDHKLVVAEVTAAQRTSMEKPLLYTPESFYSADAAEAAAHG